MKELIPNRHIIVRSKTDKEFIFYVCDRFCDCGVPQSAHEVITPFPAKIYKVSIYDAKVKYAGTRREYTRPQSTYITVKPLNSKHKYSFCIGKEVDVEIVDKDMAEVLYGQS